MQWGLPSTGGSDYCYAEHVGKTATKLVNPIGNMADLVGEIKQGGRREIWQRFPKCRQKTSEQLDKDVLFFLSCYG